MTKVVVDEALRFKLNGLKEQLELCDESGQGLGRFLPENVYKKLMYSADQCPYTEAELEQARHETGGRTLAEIWKSLGRT